ncbi:MAG: helix-turn-helix domain-containing protein [Actinomycetota bacterium]|nr:helix-turn-helix domain-containing protein [Actinomycetota bacterium]
MKWSEIAGQECSIARALSIVGDSWTMLVVRELFNGNRRFNGLQAATQAPPAILSERLSMLETEAIVEKRPYSARADRFEYRLTAKGRDLYPILLTLMAWGDRWMTEAGAPPPVRLRHTPCGHETHPHLSCSECGDAIDPRAVTKLTDEPPGG